MDTGNSAFSASYCHILKRY